MSFSNEREHPREPELTFKDHGADKLRLVHSQHYNWPIEFYAVASDGGTEIRIDMTRDEFREWLEHVQAWVGEWPDVDV